MSTRSLSDFQYNGESVETFGKLARVFEKIAATEVREYIEEFILWYVGLCVVKYLAEAPNPEMTPEQLALDHLRFVSGQYGYYDLVKQCLHDLLEGS